MTVQSFDRLETVSRLVGEIYTHAEKREDEVIKGLCLRLYVEIAKARKTVGINAPVEAR